MEQETYPAGTPCWTVMATPDAARTAAFYSGLFGWQVAEVSAGFASLRLGGREAAGLLQLPEATRAAAEASSRWLVYLASDDIGGHLAKVEAADGRILAPAFDVPGAGRMAVVSDPVGAEFGLWQGWGHPGAGVMGAPGSLTWAELYTRSRAAAAGFYSAVFDWAVEEVRVGQETFITCSIDGRPVAGMMRMSAAWRTRRRTGCPTSRSPTWMRRPRSLAGSAQRSSRRPTTSARAGWRCCVTRSERC